MVAYRSLLVLLAMTGCAMPVPVTVKASRPAAALYTAPAAAQVKRCYRTPRVTSVGRRISTRLRVRYAPDGTLAELPTVLDQGGVTPDNARYADDMAEAAVTAVLRCTPLTLPAELYRGGWDEFELTFSPSARA